MNQSTHTPHVYNRPPIDPQGQDSLAKIARRIQPGSLVLDVGCGVGTLGKYLSESLHCVVDGIDANHIELEAARPFYRHLWEWDLEREHLPRNLQKLRYDYIVCADILEHLREPGRLLQLLQDLLIPEGRFLISIPNVGHIGVVLELLDGDFRYRPEGLLDQTHIRFFTRQSFLRFLDDHGFSGSIVDQTIVPLQVSEFAQRVNTIDKLSPEHLLAEDGSVYQFILEAVQQEKASLITAPAVITNNRTLSANTTLYWSKKKDGFDEHRSNSKPYPLDGERHQIVFSIHAESMQFRLDPSDMPGDFWLYGLRALRDSQILWELDGTKERFTSLETYDIEILPYELDSKGFGLRCTGTDPQILLPLTKEIAELCTHLILDMKFIVQSDWIHALTTLQARNNELETQLQQTAEKAADLAQTITRMQHSRSWRITAPLRQGVDALRRVRVRISRLRHIRRFLLNRRTLARAGYYLRRGDLRALWQKVGHHLAAEAQISQPVTDLYLEKGLALLFPRGGLSALTTHGPVDLIVPVYNGQEHLEGFFTSLLAHSTEPYRLILVDDASSDPRIWPFLEAIAAQRPGTVLLRNVRNQGFVGTVNRALGESRSDVVLLNTDIRLPSHWLERLLSPLREPNVASVTPFTNAGTICSFPICCTDNLPFLGLGVERIDAAFARVDPARLVVNLPTAVGFCMALSKRALDSVGTLDAEAFGKGYGEENDWCMRAHRQGWVHRLASNLYVYHQHGGSFAPEEKQRLLERNLQTLFSRYPEYPALVETFIANDPARPLRDTLALLLACTEAEQAPILIIDHGRGGGANHYRERQVDLWRNAGHPVLVYLEDYLAATRTLEARLGDHRWSCQVEDPRTLLTLGNDLRFREIWYNNAVFALDPLLLAEVIAELQTQQQARLVTTIHDFYPLCPSYTLVNREDRYCELPDTATCAHCLPSNRHIFPNAPRDMVAWRKTWGKLLDLSDMVLCFSENSAELVRRVYPNSAAHITVQPHSLEYLPKTLPAWSADGPLHIGIVGAISFQKGAAVVQSFARFLAREAPSVRLTVVGTVDSVYPMPATVQITGPYRSESLPAILEEAGINLVWFPSIWPETFSYVTAEVIALGLPIACFDLGAPAERVRNYALGHILSSPEPSVLLQELLTFYAQLRTDGTHAMSGKACA